MADILRHQQTIATAETLDNLVACVRRALQRMVRFFGTPERSCDLPGTPDNGGSLSLRIFVGKVPPTSGGSSESVSARGEKAEHGQTS